MKNLKLSCVLILMWGLNLTTATAQESSYVGIIIKSSSELPLKLENVPIKTLKLFGTEKAIQDLLYKKNIVDCNFIMSGKSYKDFEKIPITPG